MPKWACATASLWSASAGSGSARYARSGLGVVGVEPAEAERGRARAPPGTSPTATGRRCSAASISGSPKPSHDDGIATDVARGVGAGHPHAERQPPPVGHAAAGEQRVELGLVAVLGRAGEPVGAADGGGEGEPDVDALARDGAGRLQDERAVGDLEPSPDGRALLGAGALGEAVVDGGGGDPAAGGERVAGELVDRDVPPGRVVGRASSSGGRTAGVPTAGRGGAARRDGRAGSRRAPRRPRGSSAASRCCRRRRGRRRRARPASSRCDGGRRDSSARPRTSTSGRPPPATVRTRMPSLPQRAHPLRLP